MSCHLWNFDCTLLSFFKISSIAKMIYCNEYRYLTVKIQYGDAHNITCPGHGCVMLVPVEIIDEVVSPEMAQRYLKFDIKVTSAQLLIAGLFDGGVHTVGKILIGCYWFLHIT